MNKEIKKPHPLGVFLNARKDAIKYMYEEMGYDDREIAVNLSMDALEAYLIRINFEKYPDGIPVNYKMKATETD